MTFGCDLQVRDSPNTAVHHMPFDSLIRRMGVIKKAANRHGTYPPHEGHSYPPWEIEEPTQGVSASHISNVTRADDTHFSSRIQNCAATRLATYNLARVAVDDSRRRRATRSLAARRRLLGTELP